MIRRQMTAVKDVNRGGDSVDGDDKGDGGGFSGSGTDSGGLGQPRLDALKDSVVARLLLDSRPPSLQTPACRSTTRRSNVGQRSIPTSVDLSAETPKLSNEDDRRQANFRSDVTSASRRLQQLLPRMDLSTILSDCRLGTRWMDLCSRLPRSPPATSLHRSSGHASSQHQHPPGCVPRESSAANGCNVHAPAGDRTTEEKSSASGSASPRVLPALHHLLTKPLPPDWIQPATSVHRTTSNQSRDPAGSPPTLKPEPLLTAPKIKQEVIADSRHNDTDVRDELKTTSGFRSASEVHESRPLRKRRLNVFPYVNASESVNGSDAGKLTMNTGSNGEYPVKNGIPSEPEVERCPSDLSTAPPDITVDRSPNMGIAQRYESIAVDRRADDCFAHVPRKRFRYEFLSYVDDGAVANSQITAAAARADVGQTGNGNEVINLTTSTRVSSDGGTTRDVAIQCVMAVVNDEGGVDRESPGIRGRRWPVHHRLPSTCDCSASADSFASFCWYCGIVFDDDVLHAIHMGCHSVADKFVCNVCGLACGDRYGFNSHLVRGHVQATAVAEQPGPGPAVPLQLPSTARLVPQTASTPASSRSTPSVDDHRWTTFERC